MESKIIYGSASLGSITHAVLLDSSNICSTLPWSAVIRIFILGIPTWYDGVLQSDWEDYFDDFKWKIYR